jgi:hypothetical protein
LSGTNVAAHIWRDDDWSGKYQPITKEARGVVLADRIEAYQSASVWENQPIQEGLLF